MTKLVSFFQNVFNLNHLSGEMLETQIIEKYCDTHGNLYDLIQKADDAMENLDYEEYDKVNELNNFIEDEQIPIEDKALIKHQQKKIKLYEDAMQEMKTKFREMSVFLGENYDKAAEQENTQNLFCYK